MWKWFTDYFDLRRSERRGAAILLFVILALIIAQYLVKYVVSAKEYDFSEIQAMAAEFDQSLASQRNEEEGEDRQDFFSLEKPVDYQLFSFDPNTLGEDGFMQLGLSKKIAGNIIKYRSKGGQFRKAEDFRKIYGISEKKFQELLPYITIKGYENKAYAKNYSENRQPADDRSVSEKRIIELNDADSLQLLSIPGIGPAFASRILKYRKKLGGFYKKEQLTEVYGLDSQRYSGISDYVSVDENLVNRININTASQDELGRHPYIGYKLAKNVVNYRSKHGHFKSIGDVKKLYSLNPAKLPVLTPYISFE